MSTGELAAKVAADSAFRTQQADDDAHLAAEAYAFGVWDKYVAAKVNDINRRINDRFGATGDTTSSAVPANPADLGKPST
jgi:hypothetical protein